MQIFSKAQGSCMGKCLLWLKPWWWLWWWRWWRWLWWWWWWWWWRRWREKPSGRGVSRGQRRGLGQSFGVSPGQLVIIVAKMTGETPDIWSDKRELVEPYLKTNQPALINTNQPWEAPISTNKHQSVMVGLTTVQGLAAAQGSWLLACKENHHLVSSCSVR